MKTLTDDQLNDLLYTAYKFGKANLEILDMLKSLKEQAKLMDELNKLRNGKN